MNGLKPMKPETYFDEIDKINKDVETRKKALAKEFALSNNKKQIGDIVEDHAGKIRIESISTGISFGNKLPECVYYGPELKRDLTPKTNGRKRQVWQTNMKK